MPKLIPRAVPLEMWKQLTPNRAYAVRAKAEDDIYLRFGPGGIYIAILSASPLSASPTGRIVNSVSLEDGNLTVLGRVKDQEMAFVGRSNDCTIRISHAVMSRQHMQLQLDGNVLIIKDLGSTNGTFYHADSIVFDIDSYLSQHPTDKAQESTLDEMHEAFGPTLNDFLKRYQESKKKNS